jgi:hypothetical protein
MAPPTEKEKDTEKKTARLGSAGGKWQNLRTISRRVGAPEREYRRYYCRSRR